MRLHQLRAWLRHAASARSPRLIHSPFVYEIVTKVIHNKQHYRQYETVRMIRKQLLRDGRQINRTDFGSGTSKLISVKDFTRTSAIPTKTGKLLFRFSKSIKPKSILELGTGTGLSAIYLACGSPDAKCVSLEGCADTAALASKTLHKANIKSPEVVTGEFNNTLPVVLDELRQIDLAFIDGNHREEPTTEYFEQIVAKSHEDTCLIFHDIHWSNEMERAWERIIGHPSVTVSIDLLDVGLIFLRNQAKEHFRLRW